VIIGLATAGVFLLAMVALSAYGEVTLPPQARVPVHWAGRYDNFRSKRQGLLTYPVISAGLYGLLALLSQIRSRGHSAGSVLSVVLPIVMCVIFVTEIGAISTARRPAGARGGGARGGGARGGGVIR
jgi:hypothetical protein